VIGSDLSTKADLVADFRQLPYPDEAFDAAVLDPPYVHNRHPRMTYHDRYHGGAAALNCPADFEGIVGLYRDGMAEARRILKPGGRLLVKGMDQVHNGRQQLVSLAIFQMAAELAMTARDQFILVPTAPPSFKRWKRQIHARKSHSFLWVFERR
jgi:tRNA G10  N-methylase Trm11